MAVNLPTKTARTMYLMIYISRERMLFNWLMSITDIYTAEFTSFTNLHQYCMTFESYDR